MPEPYDTLNAQGTLLSLNPTPSGSAYILSPYSARGLVQTLEPITSISGSGSAAGTLLRRDINGTMRDLTFPQFRKYSSDITCTDGDMPCLDDAWLGQVLLVNCAVELKYVTVGGSPARPVVSGSTRTEAQFTFYRPSLTMMVMDVKNSFSEYQAKYSWALKLQEV